MYMYVENCLQQLPALKQEVIIEEPCENRFTTGVQLEGKAHFYIQHIFCTLNLKIESEKCYAIGNICLKEIVYHISIQYILLRKLIWRWKNKPWMSRCISSLKNCDFPAIVILVSGRKLTLVGGFNPSEKYAPQNGFIFPRDWGENKKYLKPPPSV